MVQGDDHLVVSDPAQDCATLAQVQPIPRSNVNEHVAAIDGFGHAVTKNNDIRWTVSVKRLAEMIDMTHGHIK